VIKDVKVVYGELIGGSSEDNLMVWNVDRVKCVYKIVKSGLEKGIYVRSDVYGEGEV
jgi:hypothetical protein